MSKTKESSFVSTDNGFEAVNSSEGECTIIPLHKLTLVSNLLVSSEADSEEIKIQLNLPEGESKS